MAKKTPKSTPTMIPENKTPILESQQITKVFGEAKQVILKGIDLTIHSGDFAALIGKSGSGKSTLLYILSGLDTPSTGKVILDGKDLFALGSKEMHEMRNREIGFVFQFHYLLPELTGLENITMPARKTNSHRQVQDYAKHLLTEFGLEHCKDKLPSQMSGGEQQRIAIARALIQKPRFLFADEPTGNLDTANGDKVIEIFQKVNREDKTTIVFVTHDEDYARLANRRVHLQDGQILKQD